MMLSKGPHWATLTSSEQAASQFLHPFHQLQANSWERKNVVHKVPAPAWQNKVQKGGLEQSTIGVIMGTGLEAFPILRQEFS